MGKENLTWANNQNLSPSSLPDVTAETESLKTKERLKDTGFSITENLTQNQMQVQTKARNRFLFK